MTLGLVTRNIKKSSKKDSGLLKRASALIRAQELENAELMRQLGEKRAEELAGERILFLKTFCAHAQTIFVTDRQMADEVLEHVQCGLVAIYGVDLEHERIKKLEDQRAALEFFGQ